MKRFHVLVYTAAVLCVSVASFDMAGSSIFAASTSDLSNIYEYKKVLFFLFFFLARAVSY